jgi:hypothetical protein
MGAGLKLGGMGINDWEVNDTSYFVTEDGMSKFHLRCCKNKGTIQENT